MSNNSNHDPLQSIGNEAPTFTRSWLKHGESMPMIQRIGFTIFSLMFCLCGCWLFKGFIDVLRDADPTCIFFALASALFLYVGFLGLRNVLRFPKSKASEDNGHSAQTSIKKDE